MSDPLVGPQITIDEVASRVRALTAKVDKHLNVIDQTAAAVVETVTEVVERKQRRTWWAIGGVFVLVLCLVVLGMSIVESAQCQATQSEAIRDSGLQARAGWAARDTRLIALLDSQDALFVTVLNPASTPEQTRFAMLAYQQAAAEARHATAAAMQIQRDYPLPSGSC